MTKPKNSARLKLKRAKEHIDDLSAQVRRFCEGGTHQITVQRDTATEYESLQISPAQTTVPADFSIILGDALHNLACALDHAWFALTAADSPDTRKINFPVLPTREHLEQFIDKRIEQRSILAMSGKLLDEIQPYKGGNGDALYRIHHLNIADKHRLLIPQIHIGRIEGVRCEDGNGVQFRAQLRFFRDGETVAPCGPYRNVKVIDKGQCTATIVIEVSAGKEEFGSVAPVVPTLLKFQRAVAHTLDAFGL